MTASAFAEADDTASPATLAGASGTCAGGAGLQMALDDATRRSASFFMCRLLEAARTDVERDRAVRPERLPDERRRDPAEGLARGQRDARIGELGGERHEV